MPTEQTNTSDGVAATVTSGAKTKTQLKAEAKERDALLASIEEARTRLAELEAPAVPILTVEQKDLLCDFDGAELTTGETLTLGTTTYDVRRCPRDEGHVKMIVQE